MSVPAAGIRALVASAPGTSSETRLEIERVLLASSGLRGAIIRTCHRIEWYREDLGDTARTDDIRGVEALLTRPGVVTLSGLDAVGHLVSIALGLDSVVLGEDQILHQLRAALADARARGRFGGDLALAFDMALQAGRLGRTWRPGRPVSIADIALDRAEAVAGPVAGRRVLVVGSGEMGRLAVGAARSRGGLVAVSSRDRARADEMADRMRVESWAFDPDEAVKDAAVVLVALGGPWTLSDRSSAALAHGPVVVDLSMPAALSASTVSALGPRGIGIDDLASSGSESPGVVGEDVRTRRYRARLIELRDRTMAAYEDRVTARASAAAARALAARVESERRQHLEALFRGRPELASADQEAIESMTRRLTERLFGPALERLAREGEGGADRVVREVFGL